VVKNDTVVLRDEKVGEAVAVVIANRDTHPIASAWNSRFLGHVGKCAITIVVIESVAKGRIGIQEITLAAVDQIEVHPAVVVVVDESTTSSHGLREVHLR
jgi:hypothetical protein